MSLTYLYNKLENMNSKEQYAYIQNIFFQFQIRPKINIDEIFKDIDGKQSAGKNPLGYIVMHLTLEQLTQLIPKYLRDLVPGDSFDNDCNILYKIYNCMKSLQHSDTVWLPTELYDCQSSSHDMLDVFNFGVAKYSPWSFLKLNPYILIPSLFRHLYKNRYISKTDEESGLPHIAHAACNVRMIELIINNHNNEVNHGS